MAGTLPTPVLLASRSPSLQSAGMGVPYLPDRFGQPAPLFDYAMKDVWTAIEELKSLANKKFEALEQQGAEMKTMMKTLVSLQSTACPSSTPMTNEV